jgi:hypothetical protein
MRQPSSETPDEGNGSTAIDRERLRADLEMIASYRRAAARAPRGDDSLWLDLVIVETFGWRLAPAEVVNRLRRRRAER